MGKNRRSNRRIIGSGTEQEGKWNDFLSQLLRFKTELRQNSLDIDYISETELRFQIVLKNLADLFGYHRAVYSIATGGGQLRIKIPLNYYERRTESIAGKTAITVFNEIQRDDGRNPPEEHIRKITEYKKPDPQITGIEFLVLGDERSLLCIDNRKNTSEPSDEEKLLLSQKLESVEQDFKEISKIWHKYYSILSRAIRQSKLYTIDLQDDLTEYLKRHYNIEQISSEHQMYQKPRKVVLLGLEQEIAAKDIKRISMVGALHNLIIIANSRISEMKYSEGIAKLVAQKYIFGYFSQPELIDLEAEVERAFKSLFSTCHQTDKDTTTLINFYSGGIKSIVALRSIDNGLFEEDSANLRLKRLEAQYPYTADLKLTDRRHLVEIYFLIGKILEQGGCISDSFIRRAVNQSLPPSIMAYLKDSDINMGAFRDYFQRLAVKTELGKGSKISFSEEELSGLREKSTRVKQVLGKAFSKLLEDILSEMLPPRREVKTLYGKRVYWWDTKIAPGVVLYLISKIIPDLPTSLMERARLFLYKRLYPDDNYEFVATNIEKHNEKGGFLGYTHVLTSLVGIGRVSKHNLLDDLLNLETRIGQGYIHLRKKKLTLIRYMTESLVKSHVWSPGYLASGKNTPIEDAKKIESRFIEPLRKDGIISSANNITPDMIKKFFLGYLLVRKSLEDQIHVDLTDGYPANFIYVRPYFSLNEHVKKIDEGRVRYGPMVCEYATAWAPNELISERRYLFLDDALKEMCGFEFDDFEKFKASAGREILESLGFKDILNLKNTNQISEREMHLRLVFRLYNSEVDRMHARLSNDFSKKNLRNTILDYFGRLHCSERSRILGALNKIKNKNRLSDYLSEIRDIIFENINPPPGTISSAEMQAHWIQRELVFYYLMSKGNDRLSILKVKDLLALEEGYITRMSPNLKQIFNGMFETGIPQKITEELMKKQALSNRITDIYTYIQRYDNLGEHDRLTLEHLAGFLQSVYSQKIQKINDFDLLLRGTPAAYLHRSFAHWELRATKLRELGDENGNQKIRNLYKKELDFLVGSWGNLSQHISLVKQGCLPLLPGSPNTRKLSDKTLISDYLTRSERQFLFDKGIHPDQIYENTVLNGLTQFSEILDKIASAYNKKRKRK